MLKYLLLFSLFLTACATKPPRPLVTVSAKQPLQSPTNLNALPDWAQQKLSASLPALLKSCRVIAKQPQWAEVCPQALRLSPDDEVAIRRFFEARFTAWKITDGEKKESGLVTGYYEPVLKGSRVRTDQAQWPVYGIPPSLISLSIPPALRNKSLLVFRRMANHQLTVVPGATVPQLGEGVVRLSDFPPDNRALLKGRLEGGDFLPYYTRADIALGKGVGTAGVLAWVEDPVALFFLQVQGAGRIQLDDGSFIRVGYADNNGYGYQSIGRWLVANGELAATEASMQNIQRWMAANPTRQQEVFNVNPRYIFFRTITQLEGGPIGTLGVPLTDGYSIAVDPQHIPLGIPVYLSTTWPLSAQSLNRLMHAQDAGNAIRGPLRADFFWGLGDDAAVYAGRMKQSGMMWLLLPNGMVPGA